MDSRVKTQDLSDNTFWEIAGMYPKFIDNLKKKRLYESTM
jgi:hypothetical protein